MVGTLRFAHPTKPARVCRSPTPSLQAKRSNPSRRNGKAIFATFRGRSASRWWARCALPTLRSYEISRGSQPLDHPGVDQEAVEAARFGALLAGVERAVAAEHDALLLGE